MAILNQKRILNLIPKVSAPVTIHVSQGDVGTQIEFTLVKGDEVFSDTGNLSASVHGVREDGANFGPFTCTLSGSKVTFSLHSEMTAVKGSALAEIVLVDNGGNKVGSANFGILVEESVFPLGVTYDNDMSVYESILAYVQTIPAQVTADYTSKINVVQNNLNAEMGARTREDSLINTRIDEIIAPTGEAPSAAEVTDARVGADGEVFNSLGAAIRTQIERLIDDVVHISSYEYAQSITEAVDLNDLKSFSAYSFSPTVAAQCTNFPTDYNFNRGCVLITSRSSEGVSNNLRQTIYTNDNYGTIFTRSYRSGTFYPWQRIGRSTELFDGYTAPEIANNTDFNSITTFGLYLFNASSNTYSNCPVTGTTAVLIVRRSAYGTSYCMQQVYTKEGAIYRRAYLGSSTWTNWMAYYDYGETATELLENTDLDDIKTLGTYKYAGVTSQTIINYPYWEYFGGVLIVTRSSVSATAIRQELQTADGHTFARTYFNGQWYDWSELSNTKREINDTIASKLSTIIDYNNEKSFANIVFITDTHVDDHNCQRGIRDFHMVANTNIMDVCIHGGDIVSTRTPTTRAEYIKALVDGISKFNDVPNIRFIKGNHDVWYGAQEASERSTTPEMHTLLDGSLKGVVYNQLAPSTCYYYEDFNEKKVRIIYLDSYSTNHISSINYDDVQLNWLYTEALNVSDGWTVIVFAHYYDSSLTKITNILKAFANRGTSYDGYEFPTTITTHLAGVVHGHTHQDRGLTVDGVNIIGVMNAFGISDYGFDIFTIDTDNKKLYATRIGRTGSDREFEFA